MTGPSGAPPTRLGAVLEGGGGGEEAGAQFLQRLGVPCFESISHVRGTLGGTGRSVLEGTVARAWGAAEWREEWAVLTSQRLSFYSTCSASREVEGRVGSMRRGGTLLAVQLAGDSKAAKPKGKRDRRAQHVIGLGMLIDTLKKTCVLLWAQGGGSERC